MYYSQEDLDITTGDGSNRGVLVTTMVAKDESSEPTVTHNLYREGDEASATYHGDEGVNEAIAAKFGQDYLIWVEMGEPQRGEDGSLAVLQMSFNSEGEPRGGRIKRRDVMGSVTYEAVDTEVPEEENPGE